VKKAQGDAMNTPTEHREQSNSLSGIEVLQLMAVAAVILVGAVLTILWFYSRW
jgi:hypothetical protein